MLAGLEMPPAAEAGRVITAGLPGLHSGNHRGVVVHSVTGAGKSNVMVRAAVEVAGAAEPLIVTAPNNEEGDHLIAVRLHKAPKPPIGGLLAADSSPRTESWFITWCGAAPSGFGPRPSNTAALAARQVTPRVH
ncbi:hypothetical protein [Micromonospora sp. U21]|uniref:hypothetical protein n=1 Tax=Micromonospora sp. U21 TaxID=2824899 RepID=UPI001B373204|nr:hypothetical protein [Micromonospora sp. U21]MBQ0903140.1 hypothetical protein [Micromonospora sp. U21]